MAANDGENPVREMFPGIAVPDRTGLAGTAEDRSPAPDDVPATVTSPAATWWDQASVTTHGTIQPGQLDEGLSGLGAGFTADTGAGHGSASHFPRRDFQAQDGVS